MKGLLTSMMLSAYYTKFHKTVLFPQSLVACPTVEKERDLPSLENKSVNQRSHTSVLIFLLCSVPTILLQESLVSISISRAQADSMTVLPGSHIDSSLILRVWVSETWQFLWWEWGIPSWHLFYFFKSCSYRNRIHCLFLALLVLTVKASDLLSYSEVTSIALFIFFLLSTWTRFIW